MEGYKDSTISLSPSERVVVYYYSPYGVRSSDGGPENGVESRQGPNKSEFGRSSSRPIAVAVILRVLLSLSLSLQGFLHAPSLSSRDIDDDNNSFSQVFLALLSRTPPPKVPPSYTASVAERGQSRKRAQDRGEGAKRSRTVQRAGATERRARQHDRILGD